MLVSTAPYCFLLFYLSCHISILHASTSNTEEDKIWPDFSCLYKIGNKSLPENKRSEFRNSNRYCRTMLHATQPICNQLCVLEQLYVLQAVHENGVSYKLDGSYLDRAIKADFGARSEEWKHFDEKYKWKGECKEEYNKVNSFDFDFSQGDCDKWRPFVACMDNVFLNC